MLRSLWYDDDGAVVSVEYLLIGTICGIGVVAGLTSLRDGVITELADVGGAVSWLNQAYAIGGIKSHCSSTAGTFCPDNADFCDVGTVTNDPNSRCLVVCGGILIPTLQPNNESDI